MKGLEMIWFLQFAGLYLPNYQSNNNKIWREHGVLCIIDARYV